MRMGIFSILGKEEHLEVLHEHRAQNNVRSLGETHVVVEKLHIKLAGAGGIVIVGKGSQRDRQEVSIGAISHLNLEVVVPQVIIVSVLAVAIKVVKASCTADQEVALDNVGRAGK